MPGTETAIETAMPKAPGLPVMGPIETSAVIDTSALVVTFVDRSPTETWTFDLDSEFPISFRARVQASVVLVEVVDLGTKGSARVVVRKDLATQRLLTQAVLGKGVRSTDPGVREALDEALANVKEQVGLD